MLSMGKKKLWYEDKKYFPKVRVCVLKNLLLLCNCISTIGSCNLNKLKSNGRKVLKSKAKMESIYTRMIRFFNYEHLQELCLGINKWIVFKTLEIEKNTDKIYLVLDRTNWMLGKQPINILCIGVVLSNRKFVPLLSECLNKKGNSKQTERISLLKQLLELSSEFPDKKICVLGDREFIGEDWFAAMDNAGIDFVMRNRTRDYFQDVQKSRDLCSWELEAEIARDIQKRKAHVSKFKLGENEYYYHVQKNKKQTEKEPTIIWISNISDPFEVSKSYEKRWQIEVFFEDVKTKRFDVESMNFNDLDKVLMMLSICSIIYLCILAKGVEEQMKEGKTRLIFDKKANKFYPRKSIIKLGHEAFTRDIGDSISKLNSYINKILETPMQLFGT